MCVTFAELGNKGRTGNCLYQLAATIGYAKKHNVPFIFPKWQYQNDFSLDDKYYTDRNKIKYITNYNETKYGYSEIPFIENVNLSGYFQSWKYFSHCDDYIREVFAPKNPEYPEMFKDICAIHVRRGDYLRFSDHHPVQDMVYYKAAMEQVPCNRFMIFSEDIEWCKKNFVGDQYIITDPSTVMVDFNAMRCCNHFIIANSSFSWWAAYLSPHENKTVIAPKNWFGPAINKTHPIDDLIVPGWILL